MFITNNNQKIEIRVKTKTTKTLKLQYKRVKYNANGLPIGSPTTYTISGSIEADGTVLFTILLTNFNIGDELKEFIVYASTSSTNIWNTHEGVRILVNGEESYVYPMYGNNIETETIVDDGETITREQYVLDLHRSRFALRFEEQGDYEVRAVYRGNATTEMSYTAPLTYHIKQPVGSGGSTPSGVYTLEFVDKTLSSLVYDDKTVIQFQLKRGGTPVNGKTIEMATPSGSVLSKDTNANGIVSFTNSSYDCGTYKIGAWFVDQSDEDSNGRKVVSVYKDVKIKKATPYFTNTASPITKGSYVQIKLRDGNGANIPNKKITVYVNGKPSTIKTNNSANVWIKLNTTGTHKFKAVWSGNKNFNSCTKSFNMVINNG